MILMFPVSLIILGMLCMPAYLVSRKKGNESKWFLVSALPAIALWIGLTATGYGAQSLANIIEVFWVLLATIVMSYLKVFLIDPKLHRPKQTTYIMMGVLIIVVFLLRTFMPSLPE